MVFVTKNRIGFILYILITSRAWASPLLPQGIHTRDGGDEEDDAYDEEERTTKKSHKIQREPEDLDSEEIENAAIRLVLQQRLGVNKTIADQATQYIVAYLAGKNPGIPTPRGKIRIRATKVPAQLTSTEKQKAAAEANEQGVKSIEAALAEALFPSELDNKSKNSSSSQAEVSTPEVIPKTTSLPSTPLTESPPPPLEEENVFPLRLTTRRTRVRTTPRRSKPKPNDSDDDDEDDEPLERLTNRLVSNVASSWGGIKLAICTVEAIFDIECTL